MTITGRGMLANSILFGSSDWWGWALLLAILSVAIVVWGYRRLSLPRREAFWCASLKLTALALLALCLVEPLWSGQRIRVGANTFALLADNSRSLQIHDAGVTTSRGDDLRTLVADETLPWRVRLEQDFSVRAYQFDSRLQHVAALSQLPFDGSTTRLASVLEDLAERYARQPLAGVLLFTDGLTSDGLPPKAVLEKLPPIYPVVIGKPDNLVDLAVTQISTTTTSFEDAPVTLQAEVATTGIRQMPVVVEVFDENGELVKSETQQASESSAPLSFRFQLKPLRPGVAFYRVQARVDNPELQEATVANNVRYVAVDRGAGPYRLLYVSGRPNWELKFLSRALEGDEQLELTSIVRIAKKEPKFDWRSRGGESTNPLFRGFDKTDEDTERYDQPVLIRLNTRTPDELRAGFPQTAEELFGFHAILLDDLEASFFTAEQMALLERFVSERGGGLAMLGGQESFREGGFDRTPIGRMLPIYTDRVTSEVAGRGWKLALSREGWLQPWARLRATEIDEHARLEQWPYFTTLNRVGPLKPGAEVIAEVTDGAGTTSPALAVQRFGAGRVAALLIGDLWRAQLHAAANDKPVDDVAKAWRQMLRWQIADVPDRTELRAAPMEIAGQTLMKLEIRSRDQEFQPLDNVGVKLKISSPDGVELEQAAEPSLAEPGLAEFQYHPRASGWYRATAEVKAEGEEAPIVASTGWAHEPDAEEFRRIAPDHPLMQQLAEATGGEVVPAANLESFVKSLATREAPITETANSPLWHSPWVLAAVVACLCGEWFLRRTRGAP